MIQSISRKEDGSEKRGTLRQKPLILNYAVEMGDGCVKNWFLLYMENMLK
jgi:hypothetical protein